MSGKWLTAISHPERSYNSLLTPIRQPRFYTVARDCGKQFGILCYCLLPSVIASLSCQFTSYHEFPFSSITFYTYKLTFSPEWTMCIHVMDNSWTEYSINNSTDYFYSWDALAFSTFLKRYYSLHILLISICGVRRWGMTSFWKCKNT